jgi:hypothetical protein
VRVRLEGSILRRRDRLIRQIADVATAVTCLVACFLAAEESTSPVRPSIVLLGLIGGTGWAMSGWLTRDPVGKLLTVTLAGGFSIVIVASMICLAAGWWHPVALSCLLLIGASATAMTRFFITTKERYETTPK